MAELVKLVKLVKSMNNVELCEWLTEQLDEDEREEAFSVINVQKIKGKNFLNFTYEKWVASPCNLPAGVADTLVQIANNVTHTEEESMLGVHIRTEDESLLMSRKKPKVLIDQYAPLELEIDDGLLLDSFIDLNEEQRRRVFGDRRLEENGSVTQVLLTESVKEFILYLLSRFDEKKVFWSSLLVRGLSGSGKSVAMALAASYLKKQGFSVCWFRDLSEFDYSNWKQFRFGRSSGYDPVILFVDQIDKQPENISKIFSLGNSVVSIFVIGCGSGNIALDDSSSELRKIRRYDFNPALGSEAFTKLFHPEVKTPELTDFITSEMLNFNPVCLNDFYIGTRGHFWSLSKLRFYLKDKNLSIEESWKCVIEDLKCDMSNFIEKDLERDGKFYILLHQLLFKNSGRPIITVLKVTDLRFFFGEELFCSLFAQGYRNVLLHCKFSLNVISRFRVTHEFSENPSVLGFFVERWVINDFQRMTEAAFSCINALKILPVQLESKTYRKPNEIFSYDDKSHLPDGISPGFEKTKIFHFIPMKWNEESIDCVQIYTMGSTAFIVGNSISLESAQKHSKSLKWFSCDCLRIVQQVQNREFQNIYPILLFTGSQNSETYIDVDPSVYNNNQNNFIFDYPLEDALDDITWYGLKDELVKVKKVGNCRKLELKIHKDFNKCHLADDSGNKCEQYSQKNKLRCVEHSRLKNNKCNFTNQEGNKCNVVSTKSKCINHRKAI